MPTTPIGKTQGNVCAASSNMPALAPTPIKQTGPTDAVVGETFAAVCEFGSLTTAPVCRLH